MGDITDAEREVMEVLWKQAPLSTNEVLEQLKERKNWQETTVRTLLTRLYKKNILTFKKESRKFLYSPLVSREEYVESVSRNFLFKFFEGQVSPLVATFADQKLLKKKDAEKLRKLLNNIIDDE